MNHTPSRLIPSMTVARLLRGAAVVGAAGVLAACQGGGAGGGEGDGAEGSAATARPGAYRPVPTVMESGENAMRARDYDKARAEFAEVVDRDPGNPDARYGLGRAYLELGKPAEAREQMEVALAAEVENQDFYAGLCKALYEDKKLDELFRLLRQRTADRGSVSDFMTLGFYSRLTGDADEAHNALLTAARLDQGKSVAPQLALADFYESINNVPEASRRLRMAYYIDSANAEVNRRLVAFGHRLAPGLGLKPLERP
jgi:tetratricopeptide (TPR) repeat protein